MEDRDSVPRAKTGIRRVEHGDAESLAVQLARDRQALARWQPTQPDGYYTAQGQFARIERMLEGFHRGQSWPGVVLADDVVVGQVTVGTIVQGPFRKGSVGYWIASSSQNQGHATRAVGLLLEVMAGELDLHRAEASTQLENLASQRVLRTNGLVPYGVAHSHIFIDGDWRDSLLWERTLQD